MPEGRQSPPPERQTDAQVNAPPASGHGTDQTDQKDQMNKDQFKHLTSNPAGPMDASLKEKFQKK
ncbi:hypothetical protein SODALDRAFT_326759 [Sodiomyces alkalinus F11]|uniref:Uncharacterized protein n=1 Tax=Sodiomyces alkalinus (strain CBS 110278 / VKM F-3762 / F11) TaxID=1314773 RepID=A0A3N2Q739_SODAK|nr:hypothetical protein SODALDRAFT_326759 [Sodiomyces alkalinus F11]ROT42601.1 hypothetical protein SODALDRAFT_326759 [Sodiomyces alkalinus F11]